MRILFLFLDGVGLGDDDPAHNPFAAAALPTLTGFTGGQRWLRDLPRIESKRGIFIPTDACLGVEGRPQSATGQATILTGINVPGALGRHYGPRPNRPIAEIVERESVARKLTDRGVDVFLANAFPAEFFESVQRGKRLLSASQLAMQVGRVRFQDTDALFARQALSVDFTGEAWRARFGQDATPVMSPFEAGQLLARLAAEHTFTFFDHWLTDYIGHRGTLQDAIRLLTVIDGVMAGILSLWDDSSGLVILTSDHGNIEDLERRGHTRNPVPTLVVGAERLAFADSLADLTGFVPAILRTLNGAH